MPCLVASSYIRALKTHWSSASAGIFSDLVDALCDVEERAKHFAAPASTERLHAWICIQQMCFWFTCVAGSSDLFESITPTLIFARHNSPTISSEPFSWKLLQDLINELKTANENLIVEQTERRMVSTGTIKAYEIDSFKDPGTIVTNLIVAAELLRGQMREVTPQIGRIGSMTAEVAIQTKCVSSDALLSHAVRLMSVDI